MKQEILLSITMLVSDREDTIERCLESLQSLRKAVPSELIVVDTAGNETCMDIVRRYTDNIERFQWCDDFAAARNAGVRKATGQWLMFLDDDEWFENTEELERFFTSGEYQKYHSAAYQVRNYANKEGTKWNDTTASRLVKREKETCFRSKIHEQLYPFRKPTRYLQDYVHHYGYVYASEKERQEHCERNMKLLLEVYKEQPDNYHIMMQLVQEYVITSEYFTGIEMAKKMRTGKNCWGNREPYTNYAVVMEMRLYYTQKRYEEGYRVGKELLEDKKVPRMLKACLVNMMVEFCYLLENYEEVLTYIEQFPAFLKEWEKYPQKPGVDPMNVMGRLLTPEAAKRHQLMKLRILVLQEQWKEAEKTLLQVNWGNENLQKMSATGKDIVSVLKHVEFSPECLKVLEEVLQDNEFKLFLYKAVEEEKEPQTREKLLKYFSLIPPKDVWMCQYHLQYAARKKDELLANSALNRMKEMGLPLLQPDSGYWESLYQLNLSINDYMEDIGTYEWMELTKRLWEKLTEETRDKAYVCLTRGLKKEELRFLYLSALWMEQRLLNKNPETMEAEAIWEEMFVVAQYWVSCAATLYKEEVFLGELLEALPPAYRFGWYMLQARAAKGNDTSAYIRKVAEAAKAYPVMKEFCKKVIQAAA